MLLADYLLQLWAAHRIKVDSRGSCETAYFLGDIQKAVKISVIQATQGEH